MYYRLAQFRFFLALAVVIFHVWRPAAPQAGRIAVLLFFFISGFLIAKLLRDVYGGRIKEFIVNRFLRIYPIYWSSLVFAALVVFIIPDMAQKTNGAMVFPATGREYFGNIFVFELIGSKARLLPPAWSLNVELIWYIILSITFLVLDNKKLKYALLAFLPIPFLWRYGFDSHFYGYYITSGFAFALGALKYESNWKPNIIFVVGSLFLLPVVIFINPLAFNLTGGGKDFLSWINLLVAPYLLYMCFDFFIKDYRGIAVSETFVRSSAWAGSLSYPLFLVHWPSAAVAKAMAPNQAFTHGFLLFAQTTLLSLFVSAFIIVLVERPLKKYRDSIRSKKAEDSRVAPS